MNNLLKITCLVFVSFWAYSQELKIIKSIPFANPDKISVDRYGNFYVSDNKGNIYRFDKNGNKESVYSPQKIAKISLVEAWNTVKIFVFYKDLQEFVLVDRFMSGTPNIKFEMNSVGFARCASFASDNNIWIIDDVDFSLKKIDLQNQHILFSNPLQLILANQEYEINYMREYQNMLFVVDKINGILVFDNLGNYKKKLPIKNLDYIGFAGNKMFYFADNQLVYFDLYSYEEQIIKLPFENILSGIVFENSIILITNKGIEIVRF